VVDTKIYPHLNIYAHMDMSTLGWLHT